MKLYTEEQLKQLLNTVVEDMTDLKFNELLNDSEIVSIELPSNEEIEQEANIQYPVNLQPNGRTLAGGKYDVDINYSERNGFLKGAKLVLDKIQGGNK